MEYFNTAFAKLSLSLKVKKKFANRPIFGEVTCESIVVPYLSGHNVVGLYTCTSFTVIITTRARF